jgi:gliding motility-associated protein GldL
MASFFKTPGFKYGKNLLFGVGAAVVIIGAWGKLIHMPWANTALTVGLLTEAFIFAFSGIIPPEKDYYWEKFYPGLDSAEGAATPIVAAAGGGGKSAGASLDKMLEEAKIDQNAINRLGDNLKKLGENVASLSSVANASVATEEFTAKAKAAASSLAGIAPKFSQAADAMGTLASSTSEMSNFHAQVQGATKNLAALNAVYELELQDTNTHLKAMNKFIGNLGTAMTTLEESMADTAKYQTNMAALAGNIEKMNKVYGNMLSALKA